MKQVSHDQSAGAIPGVHLFSVLDRGLPMIWEVLSGPMAVLVPIVLWCCGALPKVSGKKTKEGQDRLLAVRQGLRALIGALQTALTDIQASLADDTLGFSRISQDVPPSSLSTSIARLTISGFAECRQRLLVDIVDGQRKQLLVARQFVGDRLALVKTKATFKA